MILRGRGRSAVADAPSAPQPAQQPSDRSRRPAGARDRIHQVRRDDVPDFALIQLPELLLDRSNPVNEIRIRIADAHPCRRRYSPIALWYLFSRESRS